MKNKGFQSSLSKKSSILYLLHSHDNRSSSLFYYRTFLKIIIIIIIIIMIYLARPAYLVYIRPLAVFIAIIRVRREQGFSFRYFLWYDKKGVIQ